MHMLAGIILVDILVPTCTLFLQMSWVFFVAFIIATIVMASKEIIYDKLMNKGVCSFKDFAAGEIAIIFQTIIMIIVFGV